MLRVGLVLMSVVAGTDLLFATVEGAGALTIVEGSVITALPLAGVAHPAGAAAVLLPRGRALVLAALFAGAGALDWGVQSHYSEVASTIMWIAAIVSSRRWVALAVIVSALGFLADWALQGHSLGWMVVGGGQGLAATQLIDLATNAAVVLALVAVLRRFLHGAPELLSRAREGGDALTPQLAIAVREPAERLLGRADPSALIRRLSAAERKVLVLLADGRAPKQAARDLTVSLATVRSHIASAKRKCGARTVEQLVALFAEASHVAGT